MFKVHKRNTDILKIVDVLVVITLWVAHQHTAPTSNGCPEFKSRLEKLLKKVVIFVLFADKKTFLYFHKITVKPLMSHGLF